MCSPVFLSWPTTSGSPPVLSISLSDHSFSALASSFACTLVHSRPLWRFMFFSKRAFNILSSSSRCFTVMSLALFISVFAFLLCFMWPSIVGESHHRSSSGEDVRQIRSYRLVQLRLRGRAVSWQRCRSRAREWLPKTPGDVSPAAHAARHCLLQEVQDTPRNQHWISIERLGPH